MFRKRTWKITSVLPFCPPNVVAVTPSIATGEAGEYVTEFEFVVETEVLVRFVVKVDVEVSVVTEVLVEVAVVVETEVEVVTSVLVTVW